MRTLLVAPAIALALAACSSGSKPTANPSNTDNGSGAAGSATGDKACSSDADCAVVETACCDHCNGGKAEAYNKAFADAHKATGCEGTMCTEMACGQAVASCQAGTCTATIAPLQ